MSKIFFVLLLLLIKENNSYVANDNIKNETSKKIDPGISRTFYLDYLTETNFYFQNNIAHSDLQINIRSINCKIKATFEGNLIDNINSELYYLFVNTDNISISVTPLIDIIDGEYKENYEVKKCPIAINSYIISAISHKHYE